jgi:hypothetical protein
MASVQEGHVRVVVRVRPQNGIEESKGGTKNGQLRLGAATNTTEVEYGDDAMPSTANSSNKRFTFDRVFRDDSTQEQVFTEVGRPAIDAVLKGFNGTVLAYGQTSSGKTHTMLGPSGGAPQLLASPQRGLVPRLFDELLSRLAAVPPAELTWEVQLSVFELYNEDLFDLVAGASATPAAAAGASSDAALLPSSSTTVVGGGGGGELRIREDRTSGRGVYVEGLATVNVRTPEHALSIMGGAAERKHTAGTQANETSSRSHTIVQVYVTQTNHVEGGTKTSAQLFLVDLAGSERIDKTGAVGQRLKEAQNINLSLTLLGNVINKLTDGKSLHVPYRDSKLTRLLQDSLGGNAVTTLLCACSSSTFNASETLSTLLFAQRAKRIENKPRANKVLSDDELRKAYHRALDEIRLLSERIVALEALGGGVGGTMAPSSSSSWNKVVPAVAASSEQSQVGELKETIRGLLKELQDVKEESQQTDERSAQLEDKVKFYQQREAAALEKAAEWKGKYEREKLACDSWARKFNSMMTGAKDPAKPATPAAAAAGQQQRSSSTSRAGPIRQPRPASKKPAAEGAAPATPPTPPSGGGDDNSGAVAATAEEREARALVPERMMLQQIDDLRDKLADTHKYPIIVERLTRDLELTKEEMDRKLERQTAEYEALLRRQDKEIGELQLKLDQRSQTQADAAAKQQDSVGDLSRLRAENGILHDENRANAGRLLDFAKKAEKLQNDLSEALTERDRLRREIEMSGLTEEAKIKMLGKQLQQQRSNFRRRLLECFSRDDDDS